MYEFPFVLEKRAVVATSRNLLRTAEIEIDSVTLVLDHLARLHKKIRIVSTKLTH